MFETRFDKAMWRMVADRLELMQVGDSLSYRELGELLPGVSKAQIQAAVRRATKHLEDTRQRTLATVRDTGYRMVAAAEHEDLARNHHKRSKRQLQKAQRKITSADRSLLSVAERARFDQMEMQLTGHLQMIRRLDARVAQQEVALKDARRSTKGDLALVQDRLSRLEAAMASALAVSEELTATTEA